MKRLLKFIFVLPTLLFAFTSCEETESTEDMQYANWQARNSSYFTETMNTAKNAIAAAKAQYGNDWEAHCDWRIYCSMYNDATQTGSPTDSIAVFIKERGTGNGCPLYTDTVRINFMTRTIPNELGEDAESKKLGKLVSYSGVSKNEADIFSPLYCMPNKVAVSNNVEGLTTALQYMHIGDRWQVYIPSELGNGVNGLANIPAYSTLIYDIQLKAYYRVGTTVPNWR